MSLQTDRKYGKFAASIRFSNVQTLFSFPRGSASIDTPLIRYRLAVAVDPTSLYHPRLMV